MKQDYERVRSQLVERGYLGGPLGRFMFVDWLNPASRRPASWWRPAVKAALLGAPLLSALLAVTVARANRPLVGAADFPLLWLYFAPIAAVLLFVLDAVVAWLNGALSRRLGTQEGEGTRAALIAGLPTLLYLLVLMRWRPGEQSLVYEGLFFALAVATVVAVSWLAGLVSVADVLARTGKVVGTRGRSLRTVFVFVLFFLLAAVVVRSLGTGPRAAESSAPTFDVRPAAPMLVVGVDGLDGEWVEALASGGAVERLLGRMEAGTVVPLRSETQGSPPAIWTSMMTGVGAELHGVRGVGVERVLGVATPLERSGRSLPLIEALAFLLPTRTVPVTGAARRVRTLWEIEGLKRNTLSVGWWGSWPAEPEVGGGAWVVSDRVLPKLLSGAAWDRDTWPPPLFDTLADGFSAMLDDAREGFDALPVGDLSPVVRDGVWEAFLIDDFGIRSAATLWRRADFESAFVYLPGLDILRAGVAGEDGPMPILARARLLEAYTGWLDSRIADLIDAVGPGATVALLGDPGRAAGPGAEGFLVVVGPGASPGCIEPVASRQAVATVLLALAGFPHSREMAGYEGGGCLEAALEGRASIDGYGLREVDAWNPRSEYDPEMLERLRSLGYLK